MPMSPRMKAKRGRFSLNASLNITAPAANAAVSYGVSVPTTGVATDSFGNDASASIVWTNDFDSNTFTGASGSFTFAAPPAVGSPAVVPPSTIVITATFTVPATGSVITKTVTVNAS